MKLKKWGRYLILFTIVAIILVLSFYFDTGIIKFISSLRNIYLSDLFFGIKSIDNEIIIVGILTILLLFKEKKRKWILPTWISLATAAIISVVLKILVHRPRPFMQGVVSLLPGILDELKYHIWDFSFPSFDTAFIFSTVPIVSKLFPKFKYIWIIFATLIALSRMYFGLHFLSDVVSGALIGLLIGFIILQIENKKKIFGRIYNKLFKK